MSVGLAITILYLTAAVGVVFAVHFLPTWFAGRRNAEHYWWILRANILVGWTGFGWVAVLLWALNARPRQFTGPYSRMTPDSGSAITIDGMAG